MKSHKTWALASAALLVSGVVAAPSPKPEAIITVVSVSPAAVSYNPASQSLSVEFGSTIELSGSTSELADFYAWTSLNNTVPGLQASTNVVTLSGLAAGDHHVDLEVSNVSGAKSDRINIHVNAPVTATANQAPELGEPTVDKGTLWPPNGKMVDVKVTVDYQDDGPWPGTLLVLDVLSNEPLDSPGSGKPTLDDFTTPEVSVSASGDVCLTIQLRAERVGSYDGRIYTILLQATDGLGATSEVVSVDVEVPHSQKK